MSGPAGDGPAGDASHDREAEDRSAARENAPNGTTAPEERPRPSADTAETMQHDHDSATGRQRYGDARPGAYGRDFEADGSASHPVKEASADATDGDGVPDIAATEPPESEK